MLTFLSFVRSTLRHRMGVTLAIAAGVATATAVIVGALLVGDSMRGSLRALTIERLGKIESVLAPGQFFPIESVKLTAESDAANSSSLILFPGGSVENKTDEKRTRRIGGVQILGIDPTFWDFDVTGISPSVALDSDSVFLNQSAADELGVSVGDLVTLRMPVEAAVPADSPLGKREIQSEGLPRMQVAAIVSDQGLGRFSLTPSQATPKTVFVSRELVAEVLDRDGQANAMLFDQAIPADSIKLSLQSLGWNLKRVHPDEAIDYVSLTSDALLLPDTAVERIKSSIPNGEVTQVLTYLANAIENIDSNSADSHSVPYSTISAMDSGPTLELNFQLPPDSEAKTADAEITAPNNGTPNNGNSETDNPVIPVVINDWTAKRLNADIGTNVRVFYYEPEVEKGREVERSFDAVVSQIVPITQPVKPYRRNRDAVYDAPLTPYNDPGLTPDVPGVTDQDSISDWDLPFQLERKIAREDDIYWNEHRLTPKAFVPLSVGNQYFGSRFGHTTGLRIDGQDDLANLEQKILSAIQPIQDELGWTPLHIRSQQLAASKGTTPFDGLFLALSMFVIMAAMMLIALLLRLGMLQRISEFGTLLAVGFSPRRVMALVTVETAWITLFGVLAGVAGGFAYAALVLWALKSWWVGAVTVPFLQFHASTFSIVLGGVISWLVCMATAVLTLRFLLRLDPAALLGGRRDVKKHPGSAPVSLNRSYLTIGALVAAALAAAVMGAQGAGQQAAGGFVGAGMMLLMATLVAVHMRLKVKRPVKTSLFSLASANARRSPLRSTLTIGLVATAAFLILSITAFRMSPTEEGTGGFDFIAETGSPIAKDFSAPDVQSNLLGRDASLLEDSTVVAFRMKSGDDASCNNLYQASRPTVLGVPPNINDAMQAFGWAASAADIATETWAMLERDASGSLEDPIPVVIDQNTAMWSLQMTGGIGQVKSFDYGSGKSISFEVVGLLAGSILQGKLLIGQQNFETVFENESGYRYFLIRTNNEASPDEVSGALESRLVDVGMDVQSADRVLAGLLAVQNTYLRTFQSLGALGLLLGTIGLAVAQLRSVLERRNELAVMQAIGFTRQRLSNLVLGENLYLLLMGMGCGVVTAILAVLPYAYFTGAAVPIAEPLWILGGILVFGMLAGLLAVWRALTLPLLDSLRAEHAAIEI
ncbi:ABC-type antimicrobial peptide transport system, permease component [Neorhodopirellula lusitana]|uniref:ABC-type antimicrobial peptide transport system, permease component n=1 Tax=Neorhodopirellula lusitana TaxID=445327 RepID=A0ABY1PZQ5_9BACT|nr:ABC transporter permease [Neorhodopirellula lusitana]SMP51854.1 ABC-type antimicrobial peptide transport system, permease component [Neorhodopirellula lusitana]